MNEDLQIALNSEDDLGKVIRSHVVIENYLNQLVESRMVDPESFRKMNLEYSKLVLLAISLGLNPRFLNILNVIGTLRNDFAHNIRPEIKKQDANNLYQSLNSEDKKIVQKCLKSTSKKLPEEKISDFRSLEPSDKFVLCVVAICGALHVAVNKVT
ncbi:hypothetical protein [Vibrio europaeus]|uniref:hypothetical protein n=1 Tax=Vibrio europaeus TaxID=300876 RepID=UPI00148D5CD1|nr:hypothetical protein [Vibrio europaeus]NOH26342.1 hypothetical protein [Vibrio europaeus]